MLSQQPGSTRQAQFHRFDQWDREMNFYRCDFCLCAREVCRTRHLANIFSSFGYEKLSRWVPLSVCRQGWINRRIEVGVKCSHVPHSSTDCILLLLGAGKIQREHSSEIGETTNICRHSGEGFFPALPIFSSIRAVLKSAVQRQKASAAQLWWDHPEGQKTPLLQRGCETFLGLEADTFILMLATPTVFPKISAKIWINWDRLQGSNQQRRRQGSKSVAGESGLVCLLCYSECAIKAVGSAVCPFHGASPREYSWIQFQKGEKIVFPFRHCSLFPCLIAAANEGWPQMCFFPAKGHRKIFPGNQTSLIGYYLWDAFV